MPLVCYKRLSPGAKQPTYAKPGDSCADLYAVSDCVLMWGETAVIWTDIALELPFGWEAQVRPRSGMSSRGVIVHFGTIDRGYRGRIGVTMTNLNQQHAYEVKAGDRIAQLAIVPISQAAFAEVDELAPTERGEGGYGSTGK